MNLADSVAIVISRPFALARCMANGDMRALLLGQMVISTPLVGIDGACQLGGLQDRGFKIRSRTVFLKSIGCGRFPGQRSRARGDGHCPTYHDPALDWHDGAAGPRDPGARCLSRRHFGTSHPLPPRGRVTGSDRKPRRRAPEFHGGAPANACGQHPVPAPGAASGCLGQIPCRMHTITLQR